MKLATRATVRRAKDGDPLALANLAKYVENTEATLQHKQRAEIFRWVLDQDLNDPSVVGTERKLKRVQGIIYDAEGEVPFE